MVLGPGLDARASDTEADVIHMSSAQHRQFCEAMVDQCERWAWRADHGRGRWAAFWFHRADWWRRSFGRR